MTTTNLFVIANVKQLRTDGSFRILLPFFRTSWGVGVLNSAIFNSFHNRVEFGTILEGLRNFGGGLNPPKSPPPRYATVYNTVLTRSTNLFLSVCHSFSICLPSSFSIYLHHLFFLTFIPFSSPFLSPFHPLTLFYFLLLVVFLPFPLFFSSFHSPFTCLFYVYFLYFFLTSILPSHVFFMYISFIFFLLPFSLHMSFLYIFHSSSSLFGL